MKKMHVIEFDPIRIFNLLQKFKIPYFASFRIFIHLPIIVLIASSTTIDLYLGYVKTSQGYTRLIMS